MVWLWVKLTRVPYGIMAPIILMFCTIGAYSVRNSMFDVLVAFAFGGIGFLFSKYKWPVVPMILCFILGPLLEESFIQSMAMGSGDLSLVLQRPISLTILLVAAALLVVSTLLNRRTQARVREEKRRRGVDVA
jgi:putative tricarboxylic transport membrane protein